MAQRRRVVPRHDRSIASPDPSGVTLLVNGRFLGARTTGIQRPARRLIMTARSSGLDFEVIVPSGVQDPLADRAVMAPPGRLGGNLWEQIALPLAARGRPVLSLANTAPVVLRKAAVVVHDLAPRVEPRWFRRDMRLYAEIAVAAARRASVVFTVSAQVAGELVRAGVDERRTRILRWAVDPLFTPAPQTEVEAVRERLRLERDYVLHVGWADPRKDASLLVGAHLRAFGTRPHDLVLVGSPHPNLAPVRLPTTPSLHVVGGVTDEELRALMTGAAVFAYPSRYEGFGLPPLEAMACGTPALVSDIPALHESAGEHAMFLPVGDERAWAHGILEALAGRAPRPQVPSWSWADTVGQLRDGLALLDEAG